MKQATRLISTVSGCFLLSVSLLANAQTEDKGPSYKTCLRGNPLSPGQARHCLLKAPFIQVLPSSRSEITDGQAQEWMSCFLQTSCVCIGDKWHEIPLWAMEETRTPTSLQQPLQGSQQEQAFQEATEDSFKGVFCFLLLLFLKSRIPSC